MPLARIRPSSQLANVRYEIRGPLARRAAELEKAGYEIVKLNIGNPGAFGFRAPETMRLAMIENLRESDAYCHQKGIFPAREAVVMQQQSRGVMDTTADDVFMGNGVCELILLSLRALLDEGDEVLVPSPDYPLWTAATWLYGRQGRCTTAACRRTAGSPTSMQLRKLVTPRTRAHGHHLAQQPDRRGLSARGAAADGRPRGGARPGRLLRRDLRPDHLRRRRVHAGGDAGQRTPCAGRSPASPRSTAPAASASAGSASPARRRTRASTWRRSTPSPACGSAPTSSGSGRCRPRSAASSPSASWCGRAGGCCRRAPR